MVIDAYRLGTILYNLASVRDFVRIDVSKDKRLQFEVIINDIYFVRKLNITLIHVRNKY